MAIYYFNAKIISRSKGQSVVVCAAYRAADKLYDQRYEEEYDYQRKHGVEFSDILLPEKVPAWMANREKLKSFHLTITSMIMLIIMESCQMNCQRFKKILQN